MKLPLRQYFQLLSRYLRPQWQRVSVLAFFLFSGIGLQLVAPQIVRQFIDQVQGGVVLSALTTAGLLYLGVTLVQQVARLGAAYLTEDVKWRATNWLRNDLSDHCLRLDMAFHNENTPGGMIERVDGDVTELSNFFSQFVLRVLGNAILLVGVLFFLYREDWRVGVAFTLFALSMILTLARTVSFAVPHWLERREQMSQMFGLIEEALGGTEDIRAVGGVPYIMDRLYRVIYRLFLGTRRAFLAGAVTWGTTGIFFAISTALALGVGGYLLFQGQMTLGSVYLLLAYSNTLRRPLEQLSRELQDLQSATAAIARIEELFALQPSVQEAPDAQPLSAGALAVEFDHVTFGYNADDIILKDVNFRVEPGRVLGLLGRTGSGKTTITRLLFRFHDPQHGRVCLGEEDLRALRLGDIRQGIGMVTQEVQLFQASVRDNLTFFDPTVPDEEILEALDILGLQSWYEGLEYGLDTRLSSGGKGLSAGQGQLLAFTRVFLKDPGLVILDEASSRLDPVTEHLIERAIDRLLHNRTAIIVAHRLTTVQRADDILILQDGAVVEHGERVVLATNPDSRFSHLLRTGMHEVLA